MVSAEIAFFSKTFSSKTNTFIDVTNPVAFSSGDEHQLVEGANYLFLERKISGYDVTYNFHYDVAVENNRYNIL